MNNPHYPAMVDRPRCWATQFPTIGLFERNANNFKGTRNTKAQKSWSSRAEPEVRIHLPPAESPSLSRSHFRASRTRAFPAGVRGSLDDGVSRDAAGFPLRANRRQCLCRAIFQYRSEADVVATVPGRSGRSQDLSGLSIGKSLKFGSGLSKA